MDWTAPYLGLSHLGAFGSKYRVSVDDRGSYVDLHMWYPGCGFSPKEKQFATVEEAKAAGEAWLAAQ